MKSHLVPEAQGDFSTGPRGLLSLLLGTPAPAAAPATFVQRGSATTAPTVDSGSALGRLLDRFEAWHWKRAQQRVESYLAQSANVADLESRMRDLDREGGHFWIGRF